MGVNSLPKTVTRQRRDCDLNPDTSAPESSTLTTQSTEPPNCTTAQIVTMYNTYNTYSHRSFADSKGSLITAGPIIKSQQTELLSSKDIISYQFAKTQVETTIFQHPNLSTPAQKTKVCRYNWHCASSVGWPFPMLKYKYIFQMKYTEAILSDSTRKQLWFEITKMLIVV